MMEKPSLFIEYMNKLVEKKEGDFPWEAVQAFRRDLHNKQKNHKELFDSYLHNSYRVFGLLNKHMSEELRIKFSLTTIARITVLADYGKRGRFSNEVFLDRFEDFPSSYENSIDYGIHMNALSKYVGAKGTILRDFLFTDGSFH